MIPGVRMSPSLLLCLYCRKVSIGVEHALSCLTIQLRRILTLGDRVVPVCLAMVYVCVCVCVRARMRVGARVCACDLVLHFEIKKV